MDWEFRISRCKLSYIEWVNNRVLLYSMGNYIQYPVLIHNGKVYEKIHICIFYSLFHSFYALFHSFIWLSSIPLYISTC